MLPLPGKLLFVLGEARAVGAVITGAVMVTGWDDDTQPVVVFFATTLYTPAGRLLNVRPAWN